jgi:glycerol-3-phosphate acyltransferase PlsY
MICWRLASDSLLHAGNASLAALIAALFAPVYFVFLFGIQPMALAIFLMSALLIWRHRSNIKNLLNGTEGRLGKKK